MCVPRHFKIKVITQKLQVVFWDHSLFIQVSSNTKRTNMLRDSKSFGLEDSNIKLGIMSNQDSLFQKTREILLHLAIRERRFALKHFVCDVGDTHRLHTHRQRRTKIFAEGCVVNSVADLTEAVFGDIIPS